MKIDPRDLAIRALHTFWQAFVAVFGITYAAAGLDVSQIVDLASAKKFLLALVAAAAAAALSAIKSTIANLIAGRADTDWVAADTPPAATTSATLDQAPSPAAVSEQQPRAPQPATDQPTPPATQGA